MIDFINNFIKVFFNTRVGLIFAFCIFIIAWFKLVKLLNKLSGKDDFDDFKPVKLKDKDPLNNKKPRDKDFVYIKNRTDEISAVIKNHDPYFDKISFLAFAKNSFLILFNNFSDKMIDKTSEIDIAEMYDVLKKSKNNIVNNIDIKTMYISDYSVRDGFEYITVLYYVELFESSDDPYRQYLIKFIRFTNNLVSFINSKGSITCPNCGGNAESIIRDGVCEYCGYNITLGGNNFIFADFKKILSDSDIYNIDEEVSPLILLELTNIKKESEKKFEVNK